MQSSEDIKLPPINSNNNTSGPFKVPNDNDILLNNQNNKSKNNDQKIWDKPTASCRNPLKRFDKYETPVDDKYVPLNNFNNKQKKVIETALEIIQMRKKNKDLMGKNERIVDILEQKKEMFLVTMTHGIIEKEIKNLKKQAEDRQLALIDSNQVLNQDIGDFEQFQDKEKTETKKKQENFEKQVQKRLIKEQQIKNKQITFNSLKAEKSRNEQNINSYEKYKKFLNQLPPEEWINQQQEKKQVKLKELKEKMYKQWVINQDKKLGEPRLKSDFDAIFQKLKQSGENDEIEQILNNEEMYFKQPHELIQYFNNLQQANLFCIQNVQAADQKLQQLIAKSQERKKELTNKYQAQLDQKRILKNQSSEIEAQIKNLRKKKSENSALDEKDSKDIKTVIAAQYQGMKDQMTPTFLPEIQQNAQALALLSGIEICMERLWQKLRQCYMQNPKAVKTIKNDYQKEKTKQKRQETAKKNNLEDQKRKQRNMEKKQPTTKVYGRMDMKRSAPYGKQMKKKAETNDKDINDDHQYFVQ